MPNNNNSNSKKTDKKFMQKAFSTLGSIGVGASLGFGIAPESTGLIVMTSTFLGVIGGSIVFVGIPALLEKKMYKTALAVGLGMSATWIFNTGSILKIIESSKAREIDPLYQTYLEKYESATKKEVYVSSVKLKLISQKKAFAFKINNLNKVLDKKGDLFYRFSQNVEDEVQETKNSMGKKKWLSKDGYQKIARKNLCSSIKRIRFENLVTCVAEHKYKVLHENDYLLLSETKKELGEVQLKLDNEVLKEKSSSLSALSSNREIEANKAKYDKIMKEAKETTRDIAPIAYFGMWIVGLFFEVIFMMFFEILNKVDEEKKKSSLIAITERATKTFKETRLNVELKRFMIDYANNNYENKKALDLKNQMREKRKNGRGKIIAISNSIMGALLYASTMRIENKVILSWEEVQQSHILFANGSLGKAYKNKKEKRDTIASYMTTIDELHDEVLTLGSTASELKNKNVLAYLKKKGSKEKTLSPQLEALNFLRSLEHQSPERFAPQRLSVDDAIGIGIKFVEKFYPNHFDI